MKYQHTLFFAFLKAFIFLKLKITGEIFQNKVFNILTMPIYQIKINKLNFFIKNDKGDFITFATCKSDREQIKKTTWKRIG